MRPEDLRRSSNRLGEWNGGRTEESPCEIAEKRCKSSGWTLTGPQIGDRLLPPKTPSGDRATSSEA